MRELDLDELGARRVLVVGAHPDDAEFSAGGALALLAERGAQITLVVCTDGARGGRGINDVAAVRAREQAEAAKVLGIGEVRNLGRLDGELVCDAALLGELVHAIRSTQADLVLSHDPATLFRRPRRRAFLGHSDHRTTGQAVLDALYPRARSPNFYSEQLSDGLSPWAPAELWLFDSDRPDARLDIGQGLPRKLEALRAHASQSESGGGLVEAARTMAQVVGTPERPAESFLALPLE